MPVALGLAALGVLAADAAAGAPQPHILDEKERVVLAETEVVRLSLPTQEDVKAWASPGLRVSLGLGYGNVVGAGPAWSWQGPGVMVRPSLRIDDRWAVGVSMFYGTGPGGVRWSVTAEPTFFLWRQLAVSVGLGAGGLSVSRTPGSDEPTSAVSRDLLDGEHLYSCTGSALSSLVRVEYLFVVGPLFATGPFLEAQEQWTRCRQSVGGNDRETGRPVVLTQWWQQGTATLGWWFAWR